LELYLLRHGIAEQHAPSRRDHDRILTPDGITNLQRVLTQALATHALAPRWIISSPYLRAQQTARIAADLLGYSEPILPSTRLTPESDPEDLWAEVRDLAPDDPLLFVAHNPLLESAVSWLTAENHAIINFRPATIARIDFDQISPIPRGRLQWTLHAS
jgi:phosphohistidine phosphatase